MNIRVTSNIQYSLVIKRLKSSTHNYVIFEDTNKMLHMFVIVSYK